MQLQDKFILLEEIGSGSFGEVYKGKSKDTGIEVAIKVENIEKTKRIEHEYKVYKLLNKKGVQFIIPKLIDYIVTPKYHFLCIEMLGKSLEDVFNENNKIFSIKEVLSLGLKLITIIRFIHEAGFIHRDIKPSNFLMGLNNSNLYIMDFGLAKKYISSKGEHISLKEGRSMIGTVRYCSINMHFGLEPSRRDDLESIGYMLIYFAKGYLPWQGLKKIKNVSSYERIGDVKVCTSLSDLCKDLPECFSKYILYCRQLGFKEEPDYDYLLNLFNNDFISLENSINI